MLMVLPQGPVTLLQAVRGLHVEVEEGQGPPIVSVARRMAVTRRPTLVIAVFTTVPRGCSLGALVACGRSRGRPQPAGDLALDDGVGRASLARP